MASGARRLKFPNYGLETARQSLAEGLDTATIHNVVMTFQVERNICCVLRQQHHPLCESMSVADFIEDVRVATGHVRDHDVRPLNTIKPLNKDWGHDRSQPER